MVFSDKAPPEFQYNRDRYDMADTKKESSVARLEAATLSTKEVQFIASGPWKTVRSVAI